MLPLSLVTHEVKNKRFSRDILTGNVQLNGSLECHKMADISTGVAVCVRPVGGIMTGALCWSCLRQLPRF